MPNVAAEPLIKPKPHIALPTDSVAQIKAHAPHGVVIQETSTRLVMMIPNEEWFFLGIKIVQEAIPGIEFIAHRAGADLETVVTFYNAENPFFLVHKSNQQVEKR